MKPLLCVTITAATTAELRRKRDEVVEADIIELRLDGVRDPDVSGALAGRRRPAIITCRPRWEGGLFDGSEEERRRILREAVALGSEYVDIEWRAGFDESSRRATARAASCRRTCSTRRRPIWNRASMRCAPAGAEVVKSRRSPTR